MNRKLYLKSLLVALVLVPVVFTMTACAVSVPNGTYKLDRIDISATVAGVDINWGKTIAELKALYELDEEDYDELSDADKFSLMFAGVTGFAEFMTIKIKGKEVSMIPNKDLILETYAMWDGWDAEEQTLAQWLTEQGYANIDEWWEDHEDYDVDEFNTIKSKFKTDKDGVITFTNEEFSKQFEEMEEEDGINFEFKYNKKTKAIEFVLTMEGPGGSANNVVYVTLSFKK